MVNELFGKLREKGYVDLVDIDFVIIEEMGEVSVILKEEVRVV